MELKRPPHWVILEQLGEEVRNAGRHLPESQTKLGAARQFDFYLVRIKLLLQLLRRIDIPKEDLRHVLVQLESLETSPACKIIGNYIAKELHHLPEDIAGQQLNAGDAQGTTVTA